MRTRNPNVTEPLVHAKAPMHTTIGPYRVIAPLGRGASAHVYLGEHTATRERVAIKVLDPRYGRQSHMTARLMSEREISRRVQHDGLLDVQDAAFSDDGTPYLVMELLDGESLYDLVDHSTLTDDAIVMIGCKIAAGMVAMHAAGVIHCDLKPSNIYMLYEAAADGAPRIKIVDYGVARCIDDPPLPEGEIAGTPAFMSPEQWNGAPNTKSDVYALGCMLFELVTGEPLFSGTLPALMIQHCDELPDRPSARRANVNPELERIIVRSLAKDPAMRPTMAELEAELHALRASSSMTMAAAG